MQKLEKRLCKFKPKVTNESKRKQTNKKEKSKNVMKEVNSQQ